MAMLLKREFDLVSLRVGLRADAENMKVLCTLERGEDEAIHEVKSWSATPEEFGVPMRLGRQSRAGFQIPASMAADLASVLPSVPSPDNVLWLHLDRPFGYLGLVPWETLSTSIGRPVLRLPDVLAPPPRETQTLDVALCASSPVAKSQFEVVEAIGAFVADAAMSMQRPVSIQVFAGSDEFARLKNSLQGSRGANVEITVHDPALASSYAIPEQDDEVGRRGTAVSNPWLLWIRDALKGRSLDVVHFIGHGFVAQDRGALALAESPVRNDDRESARFVDFGELSTFMTQVGAWSIAFTTPIENQWDAGVRLLADQFGLRRPGAVLHHSAALDPNWTALSQAYAFLYSSRPATPPAHPAVAIYCQPSRVARGETIELASALAGSEADGHLDQAFQQEHVPAWLASSQRYLENCEYQSKAGEPAEKRRSAARTSAWGESDTVRSTVERLQDVVARFAGTPGGGQ
jgi:hypothetical protein